MSKDYGHTCTHVMLILICIAMGFTSFHLLGVVRDLQEEMAERNAYTWNRIVEILEAQRETLELERAE